MDAIEYILNEDQIAQIRENTMQIEREGSAAPAKLKREMIYPMLNSRALLVCVSS